MKQIYDILKLSRTLFVYIKANIVAFAKRLAFNFDVAELLFCLVPIGLFNIPMTHVSEYQFTEFKVAESAQRNEFPVAKFIVNDLYVFKWMISKLAESNLADSQVTEAKSQTNEPKVI